MKSKIETIYILENPEKKIVKFATDYQLRFDDIIKDVFGVACLNDLYMMLHFNKSFQESICKSNGISDSKISLNHIVRVASRNELRQFRTEILENNKQEDQNESQDYSASCPFDHTIKLQEGIFKWDEENAAYIPA